MVKPSDDLFTLLVEMQEANKFEELLNEAGVKFHSYHPIIGYDLRSFTFLNSDRQIIDVIVVQHQIPTGLPNAPFVLDKKHKDVKPYFIGFAILILLTFIVWSLTLI